MTTTTSRARPVEPPPALRRVRAPRRWTWLAPLVIVIVLVLVYPIIEIVRLSFTDASLVSGEPYRVGLGAYASLLRGSDFRDTISVTFLFVLFSTVFQLAIGFAAALVVNGAEQRGLRGPVVTRTVVMTAWAIPGVIVGIVWSLLYQESRSGVLNYGLSLLGFSGTTPFLSNPHWALVSIIVANVWRGTALSMILSYAGLKTIPRDVYEAARVDGASAWQTLRGVTIPSMRPILLVNLVLVVVETFNTFDMVLTLTGGGPGDATNVLALDVYSEIFRQLDLGRGSAMAVVLLLINAVMIAVYLVLTLRRDREAAR